MKDDLSQEKLQTDEKLKLSVDERNKIETEKFKAEKERLDDIHNAQISKMKAKFDIETKHQILALEKDFKQFEKEQKTILGFKEKKKLKPIIKKELPKLEQIEKIKQRNLELNKKLNNKNNQVKLAKFDKLKDHYD